MGAINNLLQNTVSSFVFFFGWTITLSLYLFRPITFKKGQKMCKYTFTQIHMIVKPFRRVWKKKECEVEFKVRFIFILIDRLKVRNKSKDKLCIVGQMCLLNILPGNDWPAYKEFLFFLRQRFIFIINKNYKYLFK